MSHPLRSRLAECLLGRVFAPAECRTEAGCISKVVAVVNE
jgi:hypothetical protein